MFDSKTIEDLAKRLTDVLPESLQHMKQDLQNNFHTILQSTLAKLNLVTREEFDAQVAVLNKTRKKLDKLEKLITPDTKKTKDK